MQSEIPARGSICQACRSAPTSPVMVRRCMGLIGTMILAIRAVTAVLMCRLKWPNGFGAGHSPLRLMMTRYWMLTQAVRRLLLYKVMNDMLSGMMHRLICPNSVDTQLGRWYTVNISDTGD